jgi:hypothetical protein
MKANYDHMPQPIEGVGNGSFLINYNVEQVLKDEKTSYDCDQVLVWNEPTRDQIISAIIRDKYNQDQVEALTANYLAGKDVAEFAAFQTHRAIAKSVASGKFLKSDLQPESYPAADDRIGELEATTTAVIEVLNDKGLVP